MPVMAKKPDDRSKDRHKPRRMIAFPPKLYEQLAALAAQEDRPIQWEAHRIIRQALEAAGLWPPPPPDAGA